MKRLPENGVGWDVLKAELQAAKSNDFDWRKGVLPLYVYWRDDALEEVVRETHALFFVENALGRRAFPSVARLEAEVIEMALGLFNADAGAGGSFTVGGTESIFQAVKTARDRARAIQPSAKQPNIVIPYSAHPAFNKAAHYLDIDVVRVPLRHDYRVDVVAMDRAIDDNTILIAGSAPGFPHGVFDPIEELASLALARDLWFHVDACVGGFLAPFVRRIGYPVPAFDFSVPGVTSLSADLHKFGFAAKGASLILFRDAEMQRYQHFEFRDWPRGFYATETFLGTRAGAPVAVAWAVMNYLGEEGYLASARTIMATKERLVRGIQAIPGLQVIEPNALSFVLYRSTDPRVDIAAVADAMAERGWFVGRSVEPPAIHLMLNPVHEPFVDRYLADLANATAEARRLERVGTVDERTY